MIQNSSDFLGVWAVLESGGKPLVKSLSLYLKRPLVITA